MSTSPLTGSDLLALVESMTGKSRAEVARCCGYSSTTNDRERVNFTAFYTALLAAKGVDLSHLNQPAPRPDDAPRVYAASLSDYNDGELFGVWIDLYEHTTQEEIQAEITKMLAQSPTARRTGEPAEEWAFHDYENCSVREYDSLEKLEAIAVAYAECEEEGIDWGLFRQWQSYNNKPGSVEEFRETYQGTYGSGQEFAAELVEDLCDLSSVPGLVRYRIDYEGIWTDLSFGGDYYEIRHGSQSHIFRSL